MRRPYLSRTPDNQPFLSLTGRGGAEEDSRKAARCGERPNTLEEDGKEEEKKRMEKLGITLWQVTISRYFSSILQSLPHWLESPRIDLQEEDC